MAIDSPRYIGLFEKYREDFNKGKSFPEEVKNSINNILLRRNYALSRDDHYGKVLVNPQGIGYRIFFSDKNLLANSPGCSYLEYPGGLPFFMERYEAMHKARARIRRNRWWNHLLGGAVVGAMGESLLLFEAVKNGEFSLGLLALPLAAAAAGGILGKSYRRKVVKESAADINQFLREIKGIKTGWSALEEALR